MTENRSGYSPMPDRDLLADLIPRVVDDPGFVAWALDQYRRSEGITEDELRARLKVDERSYTRLNLCEMPVNDPAHFARHVQEISDYTGVDAAFLATLLRQVAAMEALPDRTIQDANPQPHTAANPTAVQTRALMMAARDRHAQNVTLAEQRNLYASAPKSAQESGKQAADEASEQTTEDSAEETSDQTERSSPTDDAQSKDSAHTEKSSDDNPETRSASSNDPEHN